MFCQLCRCRELNVLRLFVTKCILTGLNIGPREYSLISMDMGSMRYDSPTSSRYLCLQVLFSTSSAAAGTFYTDIAGTRVLDLGTGTLFDPKSFFSSVGPLDAVMLRAEDNPYLGVRPYISCLFYFCVDYSVYMMLCDHVHHFVILQASQGYEEDARISHYASSPRCLVMLRRLVRNHT